MNAIWITYAKDRLPLIESVEQLRRIEPDARIHIIDDAQNPLPQETIDKINPTRHVLTEWPRGGNLRGWPCVEGIIAEMQAADDGSGVLKIDSDTLVMSLDWLDRLSPHSGVNMGNDYHASGMCYWLSSAGLDAVAKSIAGRWKNYGMRVPEDVTISVEALRLFGQACEIKTWCQGLAHGWQYNPEIDEIKAPGKAIITFGNRGMIRDCKCGDEKRERVALAMHKYRMQF